MRNKIATLVASCVCAVILVPAPANSEFWQSDDPEDQSTYGDITKVKATVGRSRVDYRIRLRDSRPFYEILWIDTDADDPGPEFAVVTSPEGGIPDSRTVFVRRAESFRSVSWHHAVCENRRVRTLAHGDDGKIVVADFQRGCLRTDGKVPNRVRVRAETQDDDGRLDIAPNRHWSRWIKAGTPSSQ